VQLEHFGVLANKLEIANIVITAQIVKTLSHKTNASSDHRLHFSANGDW